MASEAPPEFVGNTYLKLQENALIVSGLWPFKFAHRFPKALRGIGYILERLLIIIGFFNSIHLAACQFKTVYDKWGASIDDLYVHGQEYMVAHTMVLITIFFRMESDEIAKLFVHINNNLRPRSARGLTYTTMEKSNKLAYNLTLIYVVFCVVGTFHHCMSPLWGGIRRLPVETWYPFDELKSPYYEVVYLLQTIGTLQSGLLYSSVISLAFSITTLMCGQYDLLYCSIHNILYSAMLKRNEKKYGAYLKWKQIDWNVVNKDLIQYIYSEEYMERFPDEYSVSFYNFADLEEEENEWRKWDSEITELLKDCAVFHSFIIQTVKASERCLRYVLAACLIHFVLLLCLLIYALSRHLVLDNTLNHILIYSGLTYALAWLMCYPGHILLYQVDFSLTELLNQDLLRHLNCRARA